MQQQFKDGGIHDNLYLTNNQIKKLLYYPDILPVFVKEIESIITNHAKKIYNINLNFSISANCHIKFMDRPSQALIKRNVDLTEISTLNTNKWLNDLKQKPWTFN